MHRLGWCEGDSKRRGQPFRIERIERIAQTIACHSTGAQCAQQSPAPSNRHNVTLSNASNEARHTRESGYPYRLPTARPPSRERHISGFSTCQEESAPRRHPFALRNTQWRPRLTPNANRDLLPAPPNNRMALTPTYIGNVRGGHSRMGKGVMPSERRRKTSDLAATVVDIYLSITGYTPLAVYIGR